MLFEVNSIEVVVACSCLASFLFLVFGAGTENIEGVAASKIYMLSMCFGPSVWFLVEAGWWIVSGMGEVLIAGSSALFTA